MHSPRGTARFGAILSLLGGALALYGLFFPPMAIGNGGGSFTPHSEWEVATVFFEYLWGPATLVVALPFLLLLVVLGMSAVSVFRALSPEQVRWRWRAALAALLMQGALGVFVVFLFTFGFDAGAGF